MSLGASSANFTEVLNDLKVSVTYQAATRTIDPMYGSAETISYASSTKSWIFFKHSSDIELKKWGIVDIGDAYVIMATTDSMNYGDRITSDSEIFEYTPDCKEVIRYVGANALYRYYTLKKVG